MRTNTLYVSGLDPSIDDATLKVEFVKHTTVERVTIIKDKTTRISKGFAYVLCADPDGATLAMKEMDGRVLADKPIKVKYSYSETPEWVNIIENRNSSNSMSNDRGRGGRGRGSRGGGGRGGRGGYFDSDRAHGFGSGGRGGPPTGRRPDPSYAPTGRRPDPSYAPVERRPDPSYAPTGRRPDLSSPPTGRRPDPSYVSDDCPLRRPMPGAEYDPVAKQPRDDYDSRRPPTQIGRDVLPHDPYSNALPQRREVDPYASDPYGQRRSEESYRTVARRDPYDNNKMDPYQRQSGDPYLDPPNARRAMPEQVRPATQYSYGTPVQSDYVRSRSPPPQNLDHRMPMYQGEDYADKRLAAPRDHVSDVPRSYTDERYLPPSRGEELRGGYRNGLRPNTSDAYRSEPQSLYSEASNDRRLPEDPARSFPGEPGSRSGVYAGYGSPLRDMRQVPPARQFQEPSRSYNTATY